jgi:hypothetical protein
MNEDMTHNVIRQGLGIKPGAITTACDPASERENQSNLKKNALCHHWRFFVDSGAGGHSFSNSQVSIAPGGTTRVQKPCALENQSRSLTTAAVIPAAVEVDVPSRLSAQASNGHPSTTCGGRWPGLSPGHDGNGESRSTAPGIRNDRRYQSSFAAARQSGAQYQPADALQRSTRPPVGIIRSGRATSLAADCAAAPQAHQGRRSRAT